MPGELSMPCSQTATAELLRYALAGISSYREAVLKEERLPSKPWCEKSPKNVPSAYTSPRKLARHSNTFMPPLRTSTLPCMQYSTQELSLDRRQDKRNILWSGCCQTIQHRFSMQVMSGQRRAL